MNDEALFDRIATRLDEMKNARRPFEPYWEKADQLCSDTSYVWIKEGKRILQQSFDSTGMLALSYFVSGMKSLLVPKTEKWHRLRPVNPALEVDDECLAYTDWVTNFLFKARYSNQSRFNSEVDPFLKSIGKYGNAVWLTEDNIGYGIAYKAVSLWECYFADNAFGQIDTLYRLFKLPARQAVKRFGEEITPEIKKIAKETPDKEVTILHAIEPNDNPSFEKLDKGGKKYASFYVDLEAKKIFKKSGYDYFPYAVVRYETSEDSVYGIGPAQKAMAEILTANEIAKTVLASAQLASRPTILLSDQANLADAGKLGTSGAIAYGMIGDDGKPLAVPMEYGANLNISLEMQEKIREIIFQHFLVQLFRTLADQNQQMTIPEVMARKSEDASILGPYADRISLEWLPNVITREIYIYNNYGLIPPVPAKLATKEGITIEFESPAIRLQQSETVEGILRTVESIIPLTQIDQSVMDIIDAPEAARYIAEFNSVPNKIVRSQKEVAERSRQRQEAMQQNELLAAAPVVSQSLKSLSEAVKGGGM